MLTAKIKARVPGILMYGITPPKCDTAPEKVNEIAEKTIARLKELELDALVVYDVQDESARTTEDRPFPFLKALDPLIFAGQYLGSLTVEKIIYRPAGKFSEEELKEWLQILNTNGFHPVFVGIPAPGHPVKTTLADAYRLWRPYKNMSVAGAVAIPERHALLNDEDKRMLDKVTKGVSFFISQCIFHVDYARQMMEDLIETCKQSKQPIPTLIFTLSACGSLKTLRFMEWLGIYIPDPLKKLLTNSDNMLEKSVEICLDIARELTAFCMEKDIPFGFNIESVAIRKQEIEASVYMTRRINALLENAGLRTPIKHVTI